jgi:hypothetical protein
MSDDATMKTAESLAGMIGGLLDEMYDKEDREFAAGGLTPAGFPIGAVWLDLETAVACYARAVAGARLRDAAGRWLVIGRFGTAAWAPPGPWTSRYKVHAPTPDEFLDARAAAVAAGRDPDTADAAPAQPEHPPSAADHALEAQAAAAALSYTSAAHCRAKLAGSADGDSADGGAKLNLGPGPGLGGALAAALAAFGSPAPGEPAVGATRFGAETALHGSQRFWLAQWPQADGQPQLLGAAFAPDADEAAALVADLRSCDAAEPEAAAAIAPDGTVWVYRGPPARRWESAGDAQAVADKFDQ